MRNLLGEMPMRENREGVKGKLEEPSDHNVSLTLSAEEREGRKESWAKL